MGVLLVQLARPAGGRVIGAARGPAKLDLVRATGAEAASTSSRAGPGSAELTGVRPRELPQLIQI